MIDDQPDHIIENEMACLSCFLIDNRTLDDCIGFLRHQHFVDLRHQRIAFVMFELRKGGKAADAEIIGHQLSSADQLANAGGYEYLASLSAHIGYPDNARHYAEEVVANWTRRQLVKLGKDSTVNRLSLDDMSNRTDEIFRSSFGSTLRVPIAQVKPSADRPPKIGVQTCLKALDQTTYLKGLPVGQMSVISAFTKGGKTALAMQNVIHALQHRLVEGVIYGTFADLSHDDLEDRVMKQLTGYATAISASEHGGSDTYTNWLDVAGWIAEQPFKVYDASASDSGVDVETFLSYCESNVRTSANGKPWMIVVDHAQEIQTRQCNFDDSYRTAKVCATKFNRWIMRHKALGVVLSQLTEGINGARDKTKDSRIWEEKAGWVCRVKKPDADNSRRVIEIPYNRFGISDVKLTVGWDQTRVSFYDL
jgi:hypothetical protein